MGGLHKEENWMKTAVNDNKIRLLNLQLRFNEEDRCSFVFESEFLKAFRMALDAMGKASRYDFIVVAK